MTCLLIVTHYWGAQEDICALSRASLQRKQMNKSPSPKLLTIKEIALLDGCSEKTVRRAIAAGRLKAIRIGPGNHLIRIHPEAHAAYRNA